MEKKLPSRKSTRLTGFDYSQPGAYFITIRTNHEDKIFGHLFEGKMYLNEFGKIVKDEWLKSAEIRQEIILDEFAILPDHFHAIVWIIESDSSVETDQTVNGRFANDRFVGANGHSPLRFTPYTDRSNPKPNPFQMRPKSISSLITGFKSSATTTINKIRNFKKISVWQRGFYDRIIRDENELNGLRQYIQNNPEKHWKQINNKNRPNRA